MKLQTSALRQNAGFTIVEMMVALTLSLFLLGAITYVVVNSNKNYNTTDSLARLQENARFAVEFLARDLRRAGYLGCANDVTEVNSTLNGSKFGGGTGGFAINSLEGAENFGASTIWKPSGATASFANTPVAGSDAIAIRYLDLNNPIGVTKEMPNESAVLFVNPGHGLKEGDIIAVTDCDGADIMQLTNVNPAGAATSGKDGLVHNAGGSNPGNSTQKLKRSYGVNSTVLKFGSFAYYIARNSSNRPALFRETTAGTEELVEGVESMQIRYGEVTGSDRSPTRYSTADDVDNWQNVVSVRVGLLFSTVANTADGQYGVDVDSGTYDVNGTTVDPADERRLRKVFVSTIMLRNIR